MTRSPPLWISWFKYSMLEVRVVAYSVRLDWRVGFKTPKKR